VLKLTPDEIALGVTLSLSKGDRSQDKSDKTQILRHCVPQNDRDIQFVILNEVKDLGF
jgi:hypothetical protein